MFGDEFDQHLAKNVYALGKFMKSPKFGQLSNASDSKIWPKIYALVIKALPKR